MHTELFATTAQILPVLFLAVVYDGRGLQLHKTISTQFRAHLIRSTLILVRFYSLRIGLIIGECRCLVREQDVMAVVADARVGTPNSSNCTTRSRRWRPPSPACRQSGSRTNRTDWCRYTY